MPFKRIQDDPRWKGGAWVFCGDPIGPFTLSICANIPSDCDQTPVNRTHAFPGFLSKKKYGIGDSSTGSCMSINIDACILVSKRRRREVADAV